MRQGYYVFGSGFSPSHPAPLTRRLLIITVAVFLIEGLIWPGWPAGGSPLARGFGLSREGMAAGHIWQILTYLFLHGGFMHLLGNMLGLYFFGRELELRLGWRRFAWLYLGAGALGGLGWLLLSADSGAVCIGASGAVFGIIGAFAALYPHRPITLLVFFVLPVTVSARTLALVAGGVSLLLLRGQAGGIAHAAHLAGGVAGYVYGMRVAGHSWGRWRFQPRVWWRRRNMRVLEPDPGPVDWHEVDRILIKIRAMGMHSLNPAERDVLDRASRQSR